MREGGGIRERVHQGRKRTLSTMDCDALAGIMRRIQKSLLDNRKSHLKPVCEVLEYKVAAALYIRDRNSKSLKAFVKVVTSYNFSTLSSVY